MYASDEERSKVLDSLQEAVDFLRATPDVAIPYGLVGYHSTYVNTQDELLAQRKLLGKVDKVFTQWDVGFERKFGDYVQLRVVTARGQVCTQVQTGTRTIPAQEATEEHEEPIYEWVCPDSVLNELAND